MNNCKLRISLILFVLLGSMTHASSQVHSLQVTNTKTGKTQVFKHNKRVKLRTVNGTYMVGKMQILEGNQVSIKGQTFSVDDILRIKKSPWLVSAITSGGVVYLGGVLFGVGTIVAIFGGPAPALWMASGGILVYAGLKSPEFGKNSGTERDLQIQVISN